MPIFWSNESKYGADPVLSSLEYPLIRNCSMVARLIIFVLRGLRGNGKLICGCYACINSNPNKEFMETLRYSTMIMGNHGGQQTECFE